MEILHDKDADVSVLNGKTVAVIGYGAQGRAQALCMRDSGVHVIIGIRPGKSWDAAVQDGFEVMSVEDVKTHARKYSKSFDSAYSPWSTNFEEMAKKTVLKRVLKYAPLKSDFARQVAADETIKTEISSDMLDVTPEPIEAEGTVVDQDTGEIKAE